MDTKQDISPALAKRIDALSARSNKSRGEIIEDALNGWSLEWQEDYARRVHEGIEAAEHGDFANDDEMNAVFAKYDPAT